MIGREEDVRGHREGGGCQGERSMSWVIGREEDVMGDRQGGGCHG